VNSPAVVAKFDHVVRIGVLLGVDDQINQRLFVFHPIHDHLPLEEPMSAVLTILLGEIEQLHVGGVALEDVLEQIRVVFEIGSVKRQSELLIEFLNRIFASPQQLDLPDVLFLLCFKFLKSIII
jgi:hypothetical protein